MDADEVADIFASFGPVKCRRMFGGLGIYADGVMFALVGFGEIYLKADDALAARLEGEGAKPFTYEGKSRMISLGYWSIPDRRLDDPDAVAEIAHAALDVARRAAEAKASRSNPAKSNPHRPKRAKPKPAKRT
ncbi:MAG: TfoX domain protein [Xanthobacteraceae bacterium]|jgi:DNA transformation protein|nr:TfoX domain protein [Xanthobacteraceae bacterium]